MKWDPKNKPTRNEFTGDERGTATVEYVVILSAIVLGCCLITIALGPPLVEKFASQVAWILLPF